MRQSLNGCSLIFDCVSLQNNFRVLFLKVLGNKLQKNGDKITKLW